MYIFNYAHRLIVNSIGEGGICVSNTNGNIENGDLLQSSDLLGYTEIDDFHTLDKTYIFTLNVCATQELHRKIEAQDVIIKSQDERINSQEVQILSQNERINELETKIERLLNNMLL